ncbi:hypothetical protein [Trichocoleus sp. FACHB-262]|uniref:hypothetical protein n=1 Tax=Trichocoleus sp. FACHB-262 TaxID=2692869 RepID=UPI001682E62E|nr:hypothetical protein [Trichocoleus sp. FACHB-262]MBD2120860.1 hypothetical protein [Trichocoleus sp. FACHB-262]
MNLHASRNLQFLSEAQYWMYGPCFKIQFYFQEKRCSPTDFESALLSDPMVLAPPPLSLPMPKEMPSRCILATTNGAKPLGFIYFGGEQGDHDYYYLATYPRQIKRHWGNFTGTEMLMILPMQSSFMLNWFPLFAGSILS